MTPEQFQKVRNLFAEALECKPDERQAVLGERGEVEPEVIAEVKRLLAVDEQANRDDFLQPPDGPPHRLSPATLDHGHPPRGEEIGARIGPYKLLQKLGEGGMGVVFMAEQESPVRRRVALKVIKPGMDTGQVVARFEAERQALAMMDHPNIARVLDAGATELGRPFFVMDLVKGVPITQYCDENRLTNRERLELFVLVCQAIQHAHLKGIIHRDIKPSNVLISLQDGKPVPKVIDFGVAKAVEQRLTEKTVLTQLGQAIGTLEYMSPEQAELTGLDIDTRSDIYSLGVLLYELLTGSTPLSRERLRTAAFAEVLRLIREEEPPKPSTRLSHSKERLSYLSARRKTEPSKLMRLVRGELDWIAMKALEKDRTRRYETASAFARDIQRHLADEPVEACPPSAGYRLRKFTRKHRAALATATAFGTLLVLGAGVSTWQAVLATRARDDAQRSERQAKNAGDKARRAAAESQATLNFFQNQVLAAARPEGLDGGLGKDATIHQAIDAAEPRIAEAFKDQPRVEASVRTVLGDTYRILGLTSQAIHELEIAWQIAKAELGPDHLDTLVCLNILALAYQADGRHDLAIPRFEETLKGQKAKLPIDHPDTLTTQDNLAASYQADGRLDLAISLFEQTLKARKANLAIDPNETLTTQNNLAQAYWANHQLELAIPLFEQTLKTRKANLAIDHPHTLITQNNLALAYWDSGRLDLAIPLLEQTLKAEKVKLPTDHPNILITQHSLAAAYQADGQLRVAIALFEETLKAMKVKLATDHPSTLVTQNTLASAYRANGQLDLAIPLFEKTLKAQKARLPIDHPDTLITRGQFVVALEQQGDLDKAEGLLRETFEVQRKREGPESTNLAGSLASLGWNLSKQRKWAEAETVLRESMSIREAKAPDIWSTFNTRSLLGGSLLGQEKYAEAEPLLLSGFDGMKAREAKIPAASKVRLADAGKRVVQLYEAWSKPDKAAEWRKRLEFELPPQRLPDDPFAR